MAALMMLTTQLYAKSPARTAASTFCIDNDGKVSSKNSNICLFSDGTECSLGSYKRGQCKPGMYKDWAGNKKLSPEQIKAKRLAEWLVKHPPKGQQSKKSPLNKSNSALKITTEQLRAKRLAEWEKTHSQKPVKKVISGTINLNFSSLPTRCGNQGLYYGKVYYHKLKKAFFIKSSYNTTSSDSDNYKLKDFKPLKLLGKIIIFRANRNATYPPGGRQKGPFQSILTNVSILQVVKSKINYNRIKRKCSYRGLKL